MDIEDVLGRMRAIPGVEDVRVVDYPFEVGGGSWVCEVQLTLEKGWYRLRLGEEVGDAGSEKEQAG